MAVLLLLISMRPIAVAAAAWYDAVHKHHGRTHAIWPVAHYQQPRTQEHALVVPLAPFVCVHSVYLAAVPNARRLARNPSIYVYSMLDGVHTEYFRGFHAAYAERESTNRTGLARYPRERVSMA